jgi:hypothetical protein
MELNLFQLPSSLMTEACAGSTEIVRSDHADAAVYGRFANDGPDHLCSKSATVNLSGFAYRAEETSTL